MNRDQRTWRAILGGVLLALPLASLTGVAYAQTAPSTPTTIPIEVAPASSAVDGATIAAIQQVIRTSNDQQTQAMALRDPSPMATTSTSDYYQWLSQVIHQNLDAGIVAVHLDSLSWGPTAVTGTTAQVMDRETWSMRYADGTTTWQLGGWSCSLVLDNGTWKVQTAIPLQQP